MDASSPEKGHFVTMKYEGSSESLHSFVSDIICFFFNITNVLFLSSRRPLGRPRHRWEDSIKMDLQEVRWGGMDWIDMAQDRDRWWALVNAVMNLRVP
jgi:hypothetical protein